MDSKKRTSILRKQRLTPAVSSPTKGKKETKAKVCDWLTRMFSACLKAKGSSSDIKTEVHFSQTIELGLSPPKAKTPRADPEKITAKSSKDKRKTLVLEANNLLICFQPKHEDKEKRISSRV
jgi:hypothetical protein